MELGLILIRTGADVARGLQLMEDDCSDERMPVCNNLGAVYDHGVGVSMDETRAARYYVRGCDAGELTAWDTICCTARVEYRSTHNGPGKSLIADAESCGPRRATVEA